MVRIRLCSSLTHLVSSWREYHHLITDGEATEIWTSRVVLPHCATGGVGAVLPEGKVLVIRLFQGECKHCSVEVWTSGKENWKSVENVCLPSILVTEKSPTKP